MLRLAAALCVCMGWAIQPSAAAGDQPPLTLFAAASLVEVMQDMAAEFTTAAGPSVILVFGASSSMARQIESGAPAHIFASAHPAWVAYLADRDLLIAGSRIRPASTELVLVAPSGASLPNGDFRQQLLALMGSDNRLAVGDPAHVPAGAYAMQALQAAGLWQRLEPRLARAENVRAALALVSRGEAAAGLVYATDLQFTNVQLVRAVPSELLAPIQYNFAVVRRAVAHPATQTFLDFLLSESGQAIFRRHGFRPASGS